MPDHYEEKQQNKIIVYNDVTYCSVFDETNASFYRCLTGRDTSEMLPITNS